MRFSLHLSLDLLDVCDRKKLKETVEAEKRFKEDDTDFGDDLAKVTGKPVKKSTGTKQSDEGVPHSEKKKGKSSSVENKEASESSDSEPEEFLSTKVGSKFSVQKKTKSRDQDENSEILEGEDDRESLNSEIGETSDLESSGVVSDDSDDCFGLNDFDDGDSEDCDDDEVHLQPVEKKRREIADNSESAKINSKLSKKKVETLGQCEDEATNDVKSSKKGKAKEKGVDIVKRKKNVNKVDSHSLISDEVLSEDDDEEDVGSEDNHSDEEEHLETKKEDIGLWEDIYGRTRDRDGNVVSRYQPPQLRKQLEEGAAGGPSQEKLARLKKQMKGLLNRLAENNMVSISSQVSKLKTNFVHNEN